MTGYMKNHREKMKYVKIVDSRHGVPIADVYGSNRTTGYIDGGQCGPLMTCVPPIKKFPRDSL
jgi:hypothetical protein